MRWLLSLPWVVLLPFMALAQAERANKPNILFIFADDQSYKTVGCYPGAYPWVKTPNLNALAASGIRFDRAYCGSWCMPSRASLLTGLHPHAIQTMRMSGPYPGSSYDPEKCRFWPAVFRKGGYHTAQIGKWHTGDDTGFGRDWDYQIVWNRPKHIQNAGDYYRQQLLTFNGVDRPVDEYSTDYYTKLACDYIRGEGRPSDKPWYLWLCYGAIHGPSTPAKRHVGAYKDAQVAVPADIFPPRLGKPAYLDTTQAWVKGPDDKPVFRKGAGEANPAQGRTFASWVQQVNECALALDEGVGQLLATLKASGQLENTLVVYTADQGFGMGEHGFRQKIAPYDVTYASPLIISHPGRIPAGKACAHPVNSPDLVVTFFRYANLELPWPMHGRDIGPLLHNPALADWHPMLFTHTGLHYGEDVTKVLADGGKQAVHSNVPWYAGVRLGHHKYIRYFKSDQIEELYDLAADPEELTNLASRPEQAETLNRLRAAWMAELKRTGANFLSHLPPATMSQ